MVRACPHDLVGPGGAFVPTVNVCSVWSSAARSAVVAACTTMRNDSGFPVGLTATTATTPGAAPHPCHTWIEPRNTPSSNGAGPSEAQSAERSVLLSQAATVVPPLASRVTLSPGAS
jgi:hypothetical protein